MQADSLPSEPPEEYVCIYIYIYIYSGTELLKCYVWDFLGDKNEKGVLIFVINPCWPHLSFC